MTVSQKDWDLTFYGEKGDKSIDNILGALVQAL